MNKKQILQQLHETANQLEKKGLYAEANVLTNVMTRVAQQTPQQPGQQAGRRRTEQEHNRLMQLYDEWGNYRDKYSLLSNDSHNKIMSGTLLQETNNVPNASLMLQQILDYLINVNNQINALLTIDGIDAQDQKLMNSFKNMIDSCKRNIDAMTQLHQNLKSKGKGILSKPQ